MARRTKAQIRAEKIAALEAELKEKEALRRELKREAAKEEKAEFDAAVLDLGRWLAGEIEARSLDQVAALREVLSNAETLRSIRDKVAAVSGVQDAGTAEAAPVVGDEFDDDEPASASTPDGDDEERSSFKPW